MLCLRYTRVEERYRLMRIVKGGEKENRRYSNGCNPFGCNLRVIVSP
jgi:hypothetical protein